MNGKSIGKALLFPPAAVLALLPPIAAATLVYAMLRLEETDPIRIGSYVLSFYALTILCARIPTLVRGLRDFKNSSRYLRRWTGNVRLRTNVTLSGSALWNGAYGALQLGLGIYHRSAWFYSLATCYAALAAMRFFLVRHTLRHEPGKQMWQELTHYRACGWIFLLMNFALSGMMFYMIYENRAIRQKYLLDESKMDKLWALDAQVTKKAAMVSIIVGVIGAMILGCGMSLIMSDFGAALGTAALPVGIALGIIGLIPVALAYPIYHRTLKKEREKIAPTILYLTNELMK